MGGVKNEADSFSFIDFAFNRRFSCMAIQYGMGLWANRSHRINSCDYIGIGSIRKSLVSTPGRYM